MLFNVTEASVKLTFSKGLNMTLPKILQDNLSIPVIGAPLFLVSGPELVIAQCKAGIVGSFPALNARTKDKKSNLDVYKRQMYLKNG